MSNNNNTRSQPIFRGVRSSKFRHVYGSPARKELCYDNIKITKNAHDGNFCAVNPKFIAIVAECAGGGSFMIIPLAKIGRIEVNYGRINLHNGPVLDLKWNPFNDNVIASCSDDCTIRLWYIPDEGVPRNGLIESILTLSEHRRRVAAIEWHPTADNILASYGFDHLIIIWNTLKGTVCRVIDCHQDTIHSLSFNRDGSQIVTTSKDKLLRIIDPRKNVIVAQGYCHQGAKASKAVFLGDSGRIFTTGFSKFSDRQWAVWNQYDLSQPLKLENIDSSSGILFPFYDHDTKMVYVAGKGDGSIRYYEVTDEAPWCYYISQLITGFPQRGLCVMPKRGLDVHRCEIFRFYKLHATRAVCEPLSMIVPRKSQMFQADIYPDTAAPNPALTADEWIQGKNRNPILISMKTGAGISTHKPLMLKKDKSDLNNDKKFIFLSQENIVDYRPKNSFNNVNGKLSRDNSLSNIKAKLFPWSKEEKTEQNITVCDIVQSQNMPTATFVTLPESGNVDVSNHQNNSINENINKPICENEQLQKIFRLQVDEINLLRRELNKKNEKIKELEEVIGKLTKVID